MNKKPKTNKTVPVLCGVFAVALAVMAAALFLAGSRTQRNLPRRLLTPPPWQACRRCRKALATSPRIRRAWATGFRYAAMW